MYATSPSAKVLLNSLAFDTRLVSGLSRAHPKYVLYRTEIVAYVRHTDGQLIWVRLGNLRFLQVDLYLLKKLVVRGKLVLGSSISFSILRKKKHMSSLSHFLEMSERFWEQSHLQRNLFYV